MDKQLLDMMGEMMEQLTEVHSGMKDMKSEIKDMKTEMNVWFDAVDAKIYGVGERLEELSKKHYSATG